MCVCVCVRVCVCACVFDGGARSSLSSMLLASHDFIDYVLDAPARLDVSLSRTLGHQQELGFVRVSVRSAQPVNHSFNFQFQFHQW